MFTQEFKEKYSEKVVFSGPPKDVLEEFLFVKSRLEHKVKTLFSTPRSYEKAVDCLFYRPSCFTLCRQLMYKELKSNLFVYGVIDQMLEIELIKKEQKRFINEDFLSYVSTKTDINRLTLKGILVRNAKIELRIQLNELDVLCDSFESPDSEQ